MGFGILVGIQHAFEPDHISAVSTQILKSRLTQKSNKRLIKNAFTKSSFMGIVWGAGHTTSLILVGFVIYGLSVNIEQSILSGFGLLNSSIISLLLNNLSGFCKKIL